MTAFAVTVLDPATGQVWNCFSSPRKKGQAACAVPGLVNGTVYQVTAISGNARGESPVTEPVMATPLALPIVGRIKAARPLGRGAVAFVVTETLQNGSELTDVRIVCAPLAGGASRAVNVSSAEVTLGGLRPTMHSCVIHAENAAGAAESAPVIVKVRR